MSDEKKPVVGRFDYEGLAGDLDAACSTETAQEAEERRDKARAQLAGFLSRARIDFGIVGSVRSTPGELVEATRRLALLYRLVHSRRWELPPEEDTRRQAILEKIAGEAGLPNLHFQLCEFKQDIGDAILVSPNPVEAAATFFRDPPREGNPGRPFNERIAMAVDVQKKRWLEGMALENACKKVAETTRPLIGIDAVRRIYENVKKEKTAATLMRVIAAGRIMDAAAADPLIRDSAIICPRCDYETMMRDLRRLRASSRPEK
jgi:hypothetical protein